MTEINHSGTLFADPFGFTSENIVFECSVDKAIVGRLAPQKVNLCLWSNHHCLKFVGIVGDVVIEILSAFFNKN
jgi:hypothetical protein